MNKNLKYLQNIFLLLMMGFSLCAVQACSDDDDESNVLENGNLLVDGHEAVDLGLSVKWATCNVGAYNPEDYGEYYAWGETKEKSDYRYDNYKWYDSENRVYTKYNEEMDGKTVLDPSDDVATVKWGKKWRMPTKTEIDELVDKCTWKWTTRNYVNGYVIYGPSGKSIFLPAAARYTGDLFYDDAMDGYYRSSTSREDDLSCDAYFLYFYNDSQGWYDYYRDYANRVEGYSVRPVTK